MHHIRRMHKRFGLTTTGMFAIVAEFLFLLPCAVTALYCLGPYVSPRELAASPTATQLICVCVFVCLRNRKSVGTSIFQGRLGGFPTTDGADGAGTVPWLALGLMMGGVVISRFGLWLYDLVVSQMLQV